MTAKFYMSFEVLIGDVPHRIEVTDSEIVLLEMEENTSFAKLQAAENGMSNKNVLQLAHYYLLRKHVAGIPEDFRQFIMLGVQLDVESIETSEGKVSAPTADIGASLPSLSRPA